MKTFLQIILMCLIVGSAAAQAPVTKMDLRPSGFFGPDSISRYVIINMPKVNKADLYKKTLTYVNSLYQDPQAVVTAVPGESITINAQTDNIKGKAENAYYPTKYNIIIEFKDGKIKFQPTIISMVEHWRAIERSTPFYVSNKQSTDPYEVNAVWIVRDNGPLLFHKEVKLSLDEWINGYIAGIASKVNDAW